MKKITCAIMVLAMLIMTGCATTGGVDKQKAASVLSTALKIAYSAGGSELVAQRIDELAAEGKITEEQADSLKAAAQKAYDALVEDLDTVADGGEPQNVNLSNMVILAWEAGGKDLVKSKIDQLVAESGIDKETADKIVEAAECGYPELISSLEK